MNSYSLRSKKKALTFLTAVQESACGCAGMFSAPVALAIYAHAFEKAGALGNFEAFASFNGPDFYGLPRNEGKVSTLHAPTSWHLGVLCTFLKTWCSMLAPCGRRSHSR